MGTEMLETPDRTIPHPSVLCDLYNQGVDFAYDDVGSRVSGGIRELQTFCRTRVAHHIDLPGGSHPKVKTDRDLLETHSDILCETLPYVLAAQPITVEGVETEQQHTFVLNVYSDARTILHQAGQEPCTLGYQGYINGKPAPREPFTAYLRNFRSRADALNPPHMVHRDASGTHACPRRLTE